MSYLYKTNHGPYWLPSIETQLNPTVMQHIVTSLRIQNTSVTAESGISLSMPGFMCRSMIIFLKCDVTRVFTPSPVTDSHIFLDPLPLERDILSGRPPRPKWTACTPVMRYLDVDYCQICVWSLEMISFFSKTELPLIVLVIPWSFELERFWVHRTP